ncbi:MAG: chorismate-binding protein [Nocardioidaceae bacterium]|nr:chorismate-binding protein [Nocardioidaceae bacterium]
MSQNPVPTGVRRHRLEGARFPVDVLRRLPRGDRLVALVGAWHHGEALVAWDPVTTAASPFDCEAPSGTVDAEAFGGGWIGVWGYRLGGDLEQLPPSPPRPVPQPSHRIGYYDRVLRRVDGVWWFEQLTGLHAEPVERARAAAFLDVARGALSDSPASVERTFDVGPFAMTPSPDEHLLAVARTIGHIVAGDVFQANLAVRLEATFAGDPLALFCRGVEVLHPARAAYVEDDQGAVVSLSPELFLRRVGRDVVTSPIKGTAPLDTDPRRLAGSSKDRAENVMIVDLMRNDLGRVAEPGGVRVTAVNRVERHAVWHLVSDVTARLRDDVGDGDLLRATFPPGSVTGAPKIRAMEVIGSLEATARESYTGAIGHLSPHAGLELNVAIRTFEVAHGTVWLGVGGGIVADSDPRAELVECCTKALPLLAAVGSSLATPLPPEAPSSPGADGTPLPRPPHAALFETMLVRDGRAVDLGDHLARLDASAREVLGAGVGDDLRATATNAATTLRGDHRLRIDARREAGLVRTTLTTSALGAPPVACTLGVLTVPGGLGAHKWADRGPLDVTLPPERDQLVVDVDGRVLETGRAALLVVIDDEVCAPVLDGRQLPSTGRERVRVALERAGLPLVERTLDLRDLARATEVLTVNALRSVVPVTAIDGVGRWPAGWVTTWLRDGARAGRADGGRARPGSSPSSARVMFVDNYDSFVHNLVQHVGALGARTTVRRHDEITVDELDGLCRSGEVTHVVISPGPGGPADAGISVEVVRRLGPTVPVLGVCLGHQAIAHAYGARVTRSGSPRHGKPCLVRHDGRGLLGGLPSPLVVGRYHSLVVDSASLPDDLEVTATTPSGLVMGVRHRRHPVEGVQWHPESILTPVGHAILDRFLARDRP